MIELDCVATRIGPRPFLAANRRQECLRSLSVRSIVVLVGLMLWAIQAPADTWTNVAGQAIEAEAVALDGRTVVLRRPSGQELRLPIFSLAPDEQRRVKILFNGPEIPAALQPAYAYAADQLDRARLLFTDGQLSDEEYAARRREILLTFKKACADQSFPETGDEVRQLTERLLSR